MKGVNHWPDLGLHGGFLHRATGSNAGGGRARMAGLAVIIAAVRVRLLLRELLCRLCLTALPARLLPTSSLCDPFHLHVYMTVQNDMT